MTTEWKSKETEKINKLLVIVFKKNTVKHEGDSDTNGNVAFRRIGDQKKGGNHTNRLGYREESWRLEKIYCHSESSERPSAKAAVKKKTRNERNNDINNP